MMARIYPGDGDARHGTDNGYRNLRCRCPECTTAHSAALTRERAKRAPLAFWDPRHGTYGAYTNWGCRCDACRAATAEQQRAAYAARVHNRALLARMTES